MTHQETAFSSWLYRAADDVERVHFAVPVGVLVTPRYRIEAEIGAGGFGTVHEATDLVLSRRVALKLIHASHLGGTQDLNPYLRTFLREARVTSQLIHRNIVTVHDLGRVEDCREAPVLDGAPFMVTELVEGTSLRERLGKPMELTECLDIVLAISEALIHAHGHGVLHRDLKPENVMCTQDGIKVLDFGIAESFERTDRILRPSNVEVLPQDEVLVGAGTPGYMAPEQVAGGHQDQRTDLFGLGVLMYELFAGQRPSVVPKPLRSFRPDVPAGLAELVHSCIALSPDERPASAAQLRELLQRHRSLLQPDETTPTHIAAAICPFPGLAAFDDSMVPYFFGRERESIECLDLVDATPRWLWIEARSGQGKSSFVRAGLLALLRARWPLRADTMTERWLSRSELELEGFVVDDDGPAIFVIDQLEELGLGDEEARGRASAAIQRILQERRSATLLITTIRSDLVPEVLGVLDITSALNRHGRRYTLPKLKGDALRQAVEGPATLAGLHLEPGLSDTILSDCGTGQSTLPLVADILRTLYERRDGRTLRLADYYALGRVGGSVARWAEALVATVPKEEMLRALLIALICIRDGRPTSRPLTVQAAIKAAGGGTAGRALLMSCLRSNAEQGAHRLLTAESLQDEARVELVHEALITSWPRLRDWVSEHAEAIAARDEVESSAKAWNAAGRLDDGLTRGDQLAYFRTATDASELARAFLKRSAEREQEEAARILRRRRVVQVVGVVALAVFAGTVGWTLNERRQAEALRSKSVEIAQRATTLMSSEQPVTGTLARRTKIHDEVAQVLEASAQQGAPPSLLDRIGIAEHRMRDHHQGDDFEAVLRIVDRTLEAIEAHLQAAPDDTEVLRRAGWFTYRAFWSVIEAAGSRAAVEIVGRGIQWSAHYMELQPDDTVVHAQLARLWVVVSNHDAFRLIGPNAGNMLVEAGTEIIDRARIEACWQDGCNGRLQLGYSIRAHGHEINGAFGEAVADFCVVAEFQRVHLDTNDTQEAKRLLAVTDRRIAQLAARNRDPLTAHTHGRRSLVLTFDVAAENQSEQRWYRILPAVALWVAGFTDALAGHISSSRRFLGRALSWSRRHSAGKRGEPDLIRDIRTLVTLAELAYRDHDGLATALLTEAVVDRWSHYRELGWFSEEMEVEVVVSLVRSERLAGRLDVAAALIDAYIPVAASRAKTAGVFRVSLRYARLLIEQAALKCASGARIEGRSARDLGLAMLDDLIVSSPDVIAYQARQDAYAICL